jgi:two-component system, OmpR family, response regulator ResD
VREDSQPRGAVLVVEDQDTIADLVARYLRRARRRCHTPRDGPSAVAQAGVRRPDLIVLDVMLPGFDGLEVMRRVREADGVAPAIILLTARGEEDDRITGLRLGADDYMVKPFSPNELVARVDAVLRRVHASRELLDGAADEPMQFGDVHIEPAGRRVLRGGQEVALTQREFDLLAHLARHPGRVFTREQLMDAVWQFSFYTDTATVTVHMRRLRTKLEDDPGRPRLLQTVWGVGYRLQP